MHPGVHTRTRRNQALGLAVLRPSAAACIARQGFEGELRHWDITFWAERLREARYQLTDEQLRPYFALPNVLDGLFQARGPAGLLFSA